MEYIELLSLAMSFPAAILCLFVVKHWFPEASRVIRNPIEAADWLVLGVTFSFIGIFLNLMYWTTWWGVEFFLGHDHWFSVKLTTWGALWNLLTRQILILAAAWCHLHAYYLFSKKETTHPSKLLHLSVGVAILILSLIWFFSEKTFPVF